MVERIPSGIEGLDAFIGGGLLRGSITTVSGPTGSGKTTLSMQFLIGGIKNNEKGLFITLEENKRALFRNLSGYEWKVPLLERENKLLILDYPLSETEQLVETKSALEDLIFTANIERVVIDSIRPIAVKYRTKEERMTNFIKLIQNLRKWDVTTFITTQDLHPSTYHVIPQTYYNIETLTDNWIHLYYTYERKKRKRVLEIIKMKGTAHYKGLINFEITSAGIGLI